MHSRVPPSRCGASLHRTRSRFLGKIGPQHKWHTDQNARLACIPYLHSWAIRSSAWLMPLSEKVSLVCVPRSDVPFITMSEPLRMASTSRGSSPDCLTQALSFCVYIANLADPTARLASE